MTRPNLILIVSDDQGPWALGEIAKAGTDVELGTFPLPMTDDPADLKVRVNIDLSLWVPEAASSPEGARELAQFLMRPEVQDPYNAEFLAFGTRTDAPPVTDDRIAVRFQYEWHDDDGQWWRSYGNELWHFDADGYMSRREASINDVAITEAERRVRPGRGELPPS